MTQTGRPIWIKSPLGILAGGAGAGIVVANGKIAELVPAGSVPVKVAPDEFDTFDASAHVVIPGLINTHHHFYQTLTRAMPAALNRELFPWLQALYPIWAELDGDMIAASTRLALAELMLSGCTFASDHHYVFSQALEDAIDIEVEVAQELGVRVHLTRGSMSLSVKDGGLPPESVVQTHDTILAESARLADRYHQAHEGAMTEIALAPCSPFSVTAELMRDTAVLARQKGLRLHTHLAETKDETAFCIEKFGARPLDYAESLGWIGDDVWYAHGIHFNADEIRRLGETGTGVAHCPASNMVLASGVCPVAELEAAGAPVGLGVDGSASNDGSNMIQEVRQAMLLQKLHLGASEIDHIRALGWATKGSARVLGRSDVGEIKVGAQADLALFKLDEPRFSGAGDPLAALVMCSASRVDALLVAGEWRVRGGEMTTIDLERTMAQHGEAARRLWGKAGTPFFGEGALRF